MVLEACPDIVDYAKQGIALLAGLRRDSRPGSNHARDKPERLRGRKHVLGAEDAAVVVAAILQRSDAIKSPGGYLRNLTEKARAGEFSLGPVLMALIRANLRDRDRKRG